MFMNILSLLWNFHPKPYFVMHDGDVLSNSIYASLYVVLKICLMFLLHFPFMLYS